MQRRIILLVLLFSSYCFFIQAQIGIKIEVPPTPLSVLHIDPKNDTKFNRNVYTNTSDDIVITQEGKLGIGTLTPQSDVTVIDGSIRINDGSQALDKALVSDADGISTWEHLANPVSALRYLVTPPIMQRYNVDQLYPVFVSGTTSRTKMILNNIADASLSEDGILSIPPGSYTISVSITSGAAEESLLKVYSLKINDSTYNSPPYRYLYTNNSPFQILYQSDTVSNVELYFKLIQSPLYPINTTYLTTIGLTFYIDVIKTDYE